jgi:glutathione peroxidase-family protein
MILDLGEVVTSRGVMKSIDHYYMMTTLSCHSIGWGCKEEDGVRYSTYEWNGTKFLITTEGEKTHVFLPREYER